MGVDLVPPCSLNDFSVHDSHDSCQHFSAQKMKKTKLGRPRTNPTSIHLTLVPDHLARLDAFIAEQEDEVSRAEGVRRILDKALPALEAAKPRGRK